MISDKNFSDWHAAYFGYGYGSGEEFWIPALHRLFVSDVTRGGVHGNGYDHERIVKMFGGLSAWLLINTMCEAAIFEYGTSPRYGWLTTAGEMLREYISARTIDELAEIVAETDDFCLVDWCNCAMTKVPCNPLFKR